MIALALAVAGGLMLAGTAATVLIAATTPWHFIHFDPVGHPLPATLLAIAGLALLAGAAWTGRGRRPVTALLGAVAVLLLPCGAGVNVLSKAAAEDPARVVATSAGGGFELVGTSGYGSAARYRIRSTGPFGRDTGESLACVRDRVAEARFTGRTTVELRLAGGEVWTTGFAALSGRPERPLDRCR
ncbi:hypothetical protein KZZ52_54780 [Dactylosporangium sp. AC04546]|uniref:hypothetical protein n=1 Tax=Dactylosporangium sp. AC04546 TaxID=2862460 RepID=UPI001EDFAEE2|nr:hypothetical protein [Dactylosporangium sp. AC04546]WVK82906.1 hypothetical protein KZZ52_54780 [Dactylosporangium sp. AC04546]